MKRSILLLITGAILACPAIVKAQDATPAPAAAPGAGMRHELDFLSEADKQELKTAREAAFKANPDLATEAKAAMEKAKAAHEAGTPPGDGDKADRKAFREKMAKAMVDADPKVAPVLAKIKAHFEGQMSGAGE